MLGLESRNRGELLESLRDEWKDRAGLARRKEHDGPSPALLITGAVVIGLGFLAWTYLGADLKRYIKIHNMQQDDSMNRPLVDQVADAVLYEGYLLYPYRPSVKNRQRWTFGGLYPRSYSGARAGTDPWMSQTECLVHSNGQARLSVRVRFLHLQLRQVERDGSLAPGVPAAWQEAVERDLDLGEWTLASLMNLGKVVAFRFPANRVEEPLPAREGQTAGTVIREQQAISGCVEVSVAIVADSLYRMNVQVRNDTPLPDELAGDRDESLLRAMVSTHAILGVQGGEFVSMVDPPDSWREIVEGCRNVGLWPVLVGEPGARDTMLSAPIILYDYPEVAPESPGDLFDAAEIDEILTLRILTLTEDEKRAMRLIDDRARALLGGPDSLGKEQLMKLHGTMRGLRPV